MSHLLDTNIVIYALNRKESVLKILESFEEDYFCISSITYLEILLGAGRQGKNSEEMMGYLKSFQVLGFDEEMAQVAGHFYHQAKKKLRFNDLMIAATAKVHGKTLVTADRDFKSMKDIRVRYVKIIP